MSVEPAPPEAPVPAASPAPEPRARAFVVGEPGGFRDKDLEGALDLQRVGPADLVQALGNGAPDVLFLDGQLPAATLTQILEVVGRPGKAGRPAVIVVTENGRRTQVEARLVDHADDFVNGSLGEEVLLARVRVALRMRAVLDELARKNNELEGLYARVDNMARRMAEELRLASHVQRSLLPPPLHHPHLDVAGEFIPVREIGGDYYDLIPLDRGRLAVAIGDVMGKGVPAALLAANLKACLRAQVQASETAPEEMIARVNRLFWEVTPKGLFASLFFGVAPRPGRGRDGAGPHGEEPVPPRSGPSRPRGHDRILQRRAHGSDEPDRRDVRGGAAEGSRRPFPGRRRPHRPLLPARGGPGILRRPSRRGRRHTDRDASALSR